MILATLTAVMSLRSKAVQVLFVGYSAIEAELMRLCHQETYNTIDLLFVSCCEVLTRTRLAGEVQLGEEPTAFVLRPLCSWTGLRIPGRILCEYV